MFPGKIASLSNFLFETRKGFLFLVSKLNNNDSCSYSAKIFIPICRGYQDFFVSIHKFIRSSEQIKRVGVSNSLRK